jgi:GT2 family glycosyltransferase
MPVPELAIVPVAFNSGAQIAATVRHLEEVAAHLPIEILVIDNASVDDTAERAESELRRGRVIRLPENVGFGRGANAGLRAASAPRVLVMNDDVLPTVGCLERMIEVLDSDPAIGLVGPRMLHPDGSPAPATRTHLPGLRDELARIGDLVRRSSRRTTYPDTDTPVDVGLLICACVMARTDDLRRLGGFNDAFFIYGEDIDLCARLHDVGLLTVTIPDAVAVHDQEVAPERRFAGRSFVRRILDARDVYYRTWLSRPERMAVNLWRAFGISDQPFRLGYHLRRVIWDGPSLTQLRRPGPLPAVDVMD